MWTIKTFKTQREVDNFIAKNAHKIQYNILFINNGYGIEYKKLRKVF